MFINIPLETYVADKIEAEKRTVKEEVDTVVVNTEVSTLMVKIRGMCTP